MICFVQGLWTLSDLVTARAASARVASARVASARVASARVKGASVAVLTIASLVALVGYYRVPKQSYRDTLAFLEQTRRPGDPVIVFGNAELGFRFYGARAQLRDSADYVYVREPAGVDSLLASRRDRPVYLVFTLGRDIRLREPDFAQRLERDWTRMRVFPATVGDGNITVMRYASPGDSAAGSARGVEPR
jgi:hypothetical protein